MAHMPSLHYCLQPEDVKDWIVHVLCINPCFASTVQVCFQNVSSSIPEVAVAAGALLVSGYP
jgi:hypothetical protein